MWANTPEIVGPSLYSQVVQTGSFGLMVYLAIWMTKQIPRVMAKQDECREAERKSTEQVAKEHREAIEVIARTNLESNRESLRAFAEQQKYEREMCSHQFEILAQGLQEHRRILDQTMTLLRDHHAAAQEFMRRKEKES